MSVRHSPKTDYLHKAIFKPRAEPLVLRPNDPHKLAKVNYECFNL